MECPREWERINPTTQRLLTPYGWLVRTIVRDSVAMILIPFKVPCYTSVEVELERPLWSLTKEEQTILSKEGLETINQDVESDLLKDEDDD